MSILKYFWRLFLASFDRLIDWLFVCLFVCLFVIIGKTAIANRTAAYLRFFHGLECRVFDVASHRRDHVGFRGGHAAPCGESAGQSARQSVSR